MKCNRRVRIPEGEALSQGSTFGGWRVGVVTYLPHPWTPTSPSSSPCSTPPSPIPPHPPWRIFPILRDQTFFFSTTLKLIFLRTPFHCTFSFLTSPCIIPSLQPPISEKKGLPPCEMLQHIALGWKNLWSARQFKLLVWTVRGKNNYNNPFETQEVFTSLLSTKLKEALTEWLVGDSLKNNF